MAGSDRWTRVPFRQRREVSQEHRGGGLEDEPGVLQGSRENRSVQFPEQAHPDPRCAVAVQSNLNQGSRPPAQIAQLAIQDFLFLHNPVEALRIQLAPDLAQPVLQTSTPRFAAAIPPVSAPPPG